MRLFRRLKKGETAPIQAAAPAAPPDRVVPDRPDRPAASQGPPSDEAQKPKRRRGSRGGRGRKKPGTGSTAATGAAKTEAVKPAQQQPSRKPKEEKTERKPAARSSRASTRRRVPAKRPPLPKAKRELLVSVDVGEQRVAVLEDDKVAEVYLERPEKRSIAGNIYLGTVDNVLPGMEAAFEIGRAHV